MGWGVGGGFSYPAPFTWDFILLGDIIKISDIFYHDLFKTHKGILKIRIIPLTF